MKNINRKKTKNCISLLLMGGGILLSAATQKTFATPSTLGYYPSTDIYSKSTFHLDVDTYGRATKTDAAISTGLTYGIGSEHDGLFGRSEIGFDYLLNLGGSVPVDSHGNNLPASERLLFNAKTQLYNDNSHGVRLVAGFWGVGNKNIFAPDVGYILGSKAFDWGRVHLGLAHSFAKDATISTLDGNHDHTYLQLGYDRYLTKKLQFAMDYYSGKSSISGIQPTFYYYVNDQADFGIGYLRYNDKDISPSRNQIYLCFDYNFGK
jgi:hypothetical protein